MLLPFHELILAAAQADSKRRRDLEFARRRRAADARQDASDEAWHREFVSARKRASKTNPGRGKAAGPAF